MLNFSKSEYHFIACLCQYIDAYLAIATIWGEMKGETLSIELFYSNILLQMLVNMYDNQRSLISSVS